MPGKLGMKSMKSKKSAQKGVSFSDAFYGTSTVGERGQIVIPADARTAMGINPGDKIVIMHHPHNKGLMLFKIEAMREFLDEFSKGLAEIEGATSKEEGEK